MHTEQIKNFLILAETLNFHRASEQTYIAQPALSRQIQNLEEEVGALLFDRSKRQISLTAAGLYFKNEVSNILKKLGHVKSQTALMAQGKAGEMRIGHASSAMHTVIPMFLSYCQQESPDLKVHLSEGTNEFIFNKLNSEEIDFGFVPNAFISDKLAGLKIYEENYVLILPKDHWISSSNFKTLSDCKNENWILHPKKEGYGYMEEILKVIGEYGYAPNIVHRSPNTSSVLRMVAAGLGITIMGKSTLKGFDLNLKSIELNDVPYQLDMKLVWKKERFRQIKTYYDFFIEFKNRYDEASGNLYL